MHPTPKSMNTNVIAQKINGEIGAKNAITLVAMPIVARSEVMAY